MIDWSTLLRKKSFKNGVWMYILQFFNAVVPLLTLPYIVRVLGKDNYGIFSVALNIIIYMQVIVEYGFGMSATRKVALSKNSDLNKLFTAVLFSRIILLAGCCVFSAFYVYIYRYDTERCLSVLILMLCLLGYCFQVNWLFQGLQNMKFISVVNIIARTISVIFVFRFVNNKNDLMLYCFLYSISPLLSGIMSFVLSIIKYRLHLCKIKFSDIISEIKDGFYVFTTQLSAKVFGAIGITFLGIFAPYSEVGAFSAIQKITNIMILAWTPITQVLYPISSKYMSDNFVLGKQFVYKMRRYILPFFVLIAVFVAIFSKFLITLLYGVDYTEYYYWLFPLLIWMIISINNNFLGIQILLGGGFDKEYSKCFQMGVIYTLLFNFLLVYCFHGTGASIAPVLSEAFLGIMLTRSIKNIENKLTC